MYIAQYLNKENILSDNELFTIVTCTYNRADKLPDLYSSLSNQNLFNFKWLIIDDCSNDKTEIIVKKWEKKTSFSIIYHRMKNNGGKYKALNYAFSKISTPLFIIIDSDDYLVENGAELITNSWEKYKNKGIGSIIMEHGRHGTSDPMLEVEKNGLIDYRYYYMLRNHIIGDYADVFVTSCVKEFRFPEFSDEYFMSELPLYYWLSQRYKSVFLNRVLTVGDYLDDGLSKNLRILQLKNWKCTLYECSLSLASDTPLWFRLKRGILYDFILLSKGKNLIKYIFNSGFHKFILFICILPAMLYMFLFKVKQ